MTVLSNTKHSNKAQTTGQLNPTRNKIIKHKNRTAKSNMKQNYKAQKT